MNGIDPGSVAVAGLGLIGGSLALALTAAGYGPVHGVEIDAGTRAAAAQAGVQVHAAPGAFLAGCRVLVLACPPEQAPGVLTAARSYLAPDAVVTDVYSVKSTAGFVAPAAGGVCYVPSHPMAGAERSGFGAARPDLFTGRPWAVTPLPGTPADAVDVVESLARAVGARPLVLDPEVHDRLVAYTSHLPYLVAMSLAGVAAKESATQPHLPSLVGPGFLDTARLAASPPELGQQFFRYNRQFLLEAARAFLKEFATWVEVLARPGRNEEPPEAAMIGVMHMAREFRLAVGGQSPERSGSDGQRGSQGKGERTP